MTEGDSRFRNQDRWRRLMAPATGGVMHDLLEEAAEFFGLSASEARDRAAHATEAFAQEWASKRVDPSDERQVIDFYNTSEAEVFDLIGWHAEDDIHHRTFRCVELAVEERASFSPDALTGLEANLRFASQENMLTRIFGRLTAWQNWIFIRPNAVGEKGALKVYGKGEKAAFDWNRV